MNSARKMRCAVWSAGALLVAGQAVINMAVAADGAGFEMVVTADPNSVAPEPFATILKNINSLAGVTISNPVQLGKVGRTNLNLVQFTPFSYYGGLTADGNKIAITPTCTLGGDDNGATKELTQVNSTINNNIIYQYQVAGVGAKLCELPTGNEISSFTITITVANSSSCLLSGISGQLVPGSYVLTSTRRGFYSPTGPNNGGTRWDYANFPLGTGNIPAYLAEIGGSPKSFTSGDVLGGATDGWSLSAYLPYTRPCAPLASPDFRGVDPYSTDNGILGVDNDAPANLNPPTGSAIVITQANNFANTLAIASGGAGRFQLTQVMSARPPQIGVFGAKRITALPLNTGTPGTTPWGGYRSDGQYVQCGASDTITTYNSTIRCRMAGLVNPGADIGWGSAPELGIRVEAGGALSAVDSFNHWQVAGSTGQTVRFRNREISWAGYGDWSPYTEINMTGGN